MCLAGAIHAAAQARPNPHIGIAAPMSDYFAVIGEQIRAGAVAAIETRGAISYTVADDRCSAEGGAESARRLVDAGVSVVIGYPCVEAIDSAMPILAEAGITLIAVGAQAEGVTAHTGADAWPLLRLAPRNAQEADAVADHLKRAWRNVNFAIIDDGTLYGRQLAEAVRLRLDEDNLKPVFTDTYRPQMENQVALVRRLQKAGATHVFIGGDAFDAAVIGANAAMVEVPLAIAGGAALIAPPDDGTLADNTVVAAFPDWASAPPAADAVEALDRAGLAADGYTLPAYAAAQIAIFGIDITGDNGVFPHERMLGRTFDTAIGPLRFDKDGELAGNLFDVFIVSDGRLKPVE